MTAVGLVLQFSDFGYPKFMIEKLTDLKILIFIYIFFVLLPILLLYKHIKDVSKETESYTFSDRQLHQKKQKWFEEISSNSIVCHTQDGQQPTKNKCIFLQQILAVVSCE